MVESPEWESKNFQDPDYADDIQINWRDRILATIRFDYITLGYKMTTFDVLSGKFIAEIFLPDGMDYGWYYDPLCTFLLFFLLQIYLLLHSSTNQSSKYK